VYWQSADDDDLGDPKNDEQFKTNLVKWAGMSALNVMPAPQVRASSAFTVTNGDVTAKVALTNDSNHIAFFMRAEITKGMDGEEILPITYDDNYVTVFPHETRTIDGHFHLTAQPTWSPALRLEGFNVGRKVLPMQQTQN
jgi:exo-1,4-beta-D-glucosaminidase